jgi:hypothetical protein
VLVGLWLMAAPAILDYGDPAATVDRILGPVFASVAVVAMSEVVRGLRWVESLAGVALVAASWLLGYPTSPLVNGLLAGGVLVAFGAFGGRVSQRFGGRWRAITARSHTASRHSRG